MDGNPEDLPTGSQAPEPWRRRAFSYVYVLRALNTPDRIYIGSTTDLRQRLQAHNWGMSPHTAAHRPWELAWYGAFSTDTAAHSFERYLKSGSGRAFLRNVFSAKPYAPPAAQLQRAGPLTLYFAMRS